ncbi:uncharacterized protein LOC125376861 [Haliotis rufescens]|uniref:uncharacterized protein LOC125376861 n=1 Tax=Haliotis rufescens TaxID=6454 RepID=UPI00201E9787|nr:uncharacterized protein LOC125376861 [Haliotis rufescens]
MSGRRRSKRKGSTTSRQSSQARGSAQRRRGSQKVAPNNATSDSAVLRDGENGDSSMAEAEVHVVPESIDEITPVTTTPSGGESVQIGFYPNNTYTPSVNSQMYSPGISNHVPQSQCHNNAPSVVSNPNHVPQSQCHNNAPSMVSNPIAPPNSQGIPMFQNVDMLNMPPPTTTQSVDDNLGCNVPVNIKNKIWNGEYINFALLLKPDRDLMDYMTTSAVFISTDGQLELRPKSQGKRIENIFDWTTAFTTYMSIYVQRRMDMVQGLLKHMNTVRLAESRHTGLGWRTYDEQYRLRQARDQSLPWGKLNVELWMLFVQTPYHQQVSSGFSGFQKRHVSTFQGKLQRPANNTCNNFNQSKCFRQKCKYRHSCSACGSDAHPACRCTSASTPSRVIQARSNTSQDTSAGTYGKAFSGSGSSSVSR